MFYVSVFNCVAVPPLHLKWISLFDFLGPKTRGQQIHGCNIFSLKSLDKPFPMNYLFAGVKRALYCDGHLGWLTPSVVMHIFTSSAHLPLAEIHTCTSDIYTNMHTDQYLSYSSNHMWETKQPWGTSSLLHIWFWLLLVIWQDFSGPICAELIRTCVCLHV